MALAGIGCHYMATWMDRKTETTSQMGGEGAAWIGQAPFTDRPHMFVNIGDGTFYHSGILAIRGAVAAGVNITYKILFNDAVAMTGGQPVEGGLTVARIAHGLRAEGVGRIAVVSDEPQKYDRLSGLPAGTGVEHRDDFDRVQREFREVEGVSAIIYDQTCAAEKRRRRKRGLMPDPPKRVVINERVCEDCGDCSAQSNWPIDRPVGDPLRPQAADRPIELQQGLCLHERVLPELRDGDRRQPAGRGGTGWSRKRSLRKSSFPPHRPCPNPNPRPWNTPMGY